MSDLHQKTRSASSNNSPSMAEDKRSRKPSPSVRTRDIPEVLDARSTAAHRTIQAPARWPSHVADRLTKIATIQRSIHNRSLGPVLLIVRAPHCGAARELHRSLRRALSRQISTHSEPAAAA